MGIKLKMQKNSIVDLANRWVYIKNKSKKIKEKEGEYLQAAGNPLLLKIVKWINKYLTIIKRVHHYPEF